MIGALYFLRPVRSATLVLALMTLVGFVSPRDARAGAEHDNILRLHIIANSDSSADQRVKLLVRDAILAMLPASDSASEAEAYVLHNGAALLRAAEETLRKNGFPYGAQLLLGTSVFPDRAYAGIPFPAGEYRALRIVLGRGAGQNFWCVLFPPLCIITREEQPLPADGRITFKSSIAEQFRKWRDG